MSFITFRINIPALKVERNLNRSTQEVQKANERLSSGQRITRAADDAASLAIASSLRLDSRVYFQGIRNLNDGISLLNIAEGAVTELRNILFRVQELAEQAATGTLTNTQRASLDKEGEALTNEYNRILTATDFNGLALLDGSLVNLSLQAGFGTVDTLNFSLGQELDRTVGDGTFQGAVSYSTDVGPQSIASADINGDGYLDLVMSAQTADKVDVMLGNGNGTFQARVSYSVGNGPQGLYLGDVNADGKLDLVVGTTAPAAADRIDVLLGNGNGSFQARVSYQTGDLPRDVVLADVNVYGPAPEVKRKNPWEHQKWIRTANVYPASCYGTKCPEPWWNSLSPFLSAIRLLRATIDIRFVESRS